MNQLARLSWSDAGTVLFVVYGSGHVGKVAPVIKHLRAQGVPCELLALTLGYEQARRLGLSPKGFRDFLHLVDRDRVLARGEKLLDGNSHPDVDTFESMCYLGVNYEEWVARHGEQGAADRYREGGRRSFLPVDFLGRIIDSIQPSVVVSTGSPRAEQAAIEAAILRGVPCLTMVDLFGLPHDAYLRNKVFADRITVLSGFVRSNLLTAGIDASRIVVTGCPAYDGLFDPALPLAAAELRHSLGWDDFDVVMWCGNFEEPGLGVTPDVAGTALALDAEQRLRAWVDSRPDAALLIRYHPSQYHLFPDLGAHPRIYRSVPTKDALGPQLHLAGTLVVQTSTVGFEAALIGKRVLCLSWSPMVINLDFDYGRLGLGESIMRPDDIVPILNASSARPIDRSVFPPPGLATPRVAAEILDLARYGRAALP
ncbi:MAG: hypothetical protein IV104_08840 [Acidovorax sp.]|nr:hypothetical protein [Acidovorax sp.]